MSIDFDNGLVVGLTIGAKFSGAIYTGGGGLGGLAGSISLGHPYLILSGWVGTVSGIKD